MISICWQWSFKKVAAASANRANSATSNLLTGPSAPFAKSANLAFVAPMSPSKTCLVKIDSSRFDCECPPHSKHAALTHATADPD